MGPDRDGLTAETGLLRAWPEGGPERVWLFENCGLGYSGPAIVNGKLYVMGSRGGVEQLLCLDAATGDELWAADLGEEYDNGWGNGPRGTPTINGDRIYVLAAKGALVCLSLGGEELWRADMRDYGGMIPVWGYSESPLIDGDRVIVTPGVKQKSKKKKDKKQDGPTEQATPAEPLPGTAILALDKRTGEKLWQTSQVTSPPHYASIVKAEINGQPQYVQLLVDQLVGVRPETGELLWTVPWPGQVAVIPTPIVRDNRVYVTTGYGVGCMLVEIASDNTATVVYDNKLMKNHHGGVVLLEDKLYGHSDGVGWLCQDFATGKRVWRERSAPRQGRHRLRRRPLLLPQRRRRRGRADRGLPRRLDRTRPLHPRATNRAPQTEGQDLDSPGDRRRQALPARSGVAVLLRYLGRIKRAHESHKSTRIELVSTMWLHRWCQELFGSVAESVSSQRFKLSIDSDQHGVTLSRAVRGRGSSITTIKWESINGIRAYKRDLGTIDTICLAFQMSDHWYEVCEEDEGFLGLAEAIRFRFPTVPKDWYSEVMAPAFETDLRTLWRRE